MLDNRILPQLILIVLLTLMNGFFASAEMAIVSVNKNRIKSLKESGNKKAKLLETLLYEPSNFLSTIQVGITLGGFFSSASAATGLADNFSHYLARLSIPYSAQIAVILITIVLSFLTLIFGELVPKQIALNKPERIALLTVRPIIIVSKIALPFVKLQSFTSKTILKFLGYTEFSNNEEISKKEILTILESSYEQGNINDQVLNMAHNLLKFTDKYAYQIMTPRAKVFMIDINKPTPHNIAKIMQHQYSRIPVYENNIDNIIGVLYLKDFMTAAYESGFSHVSIRKLLRQPYLVKKMKSIDKLLIDMQGHKSHLALIIDEFGGFTGIITIEDIIEEVMGPIYDEYDH